MNALRCFCLLVITVLGSHVIPSAAGADITVGSDGSDGTLIVTSSTTIDLSEATTAAWDTPSPVPGNGVYDSQRWAVVFKYDSVYVGPGVTLRFSNHPTTAPVVWLVARGVRIDGIVNLDGGNALGGRHAIPGAGGFRGGKGESAITGGGGPGMGLGGGRFSDYGGSGAGYGSNGFNGRTGGGLEVPGGGSYGTVQILPLIGGSGGGATSYTIDNGGGAGGGALLIAATRRVLISGTIEADGGNGATSYGGGGSGGAIRVVADGIDGGGNLFARGGTGYGAGGVGRIRLEANTITFTGGSAPVYTLHLPVGSVGTVWPPAGSPSISIATVAGQVVPADPNGNLLGGDVQIGSARSVPVTISALNVPTNSTMTLRAVLVSGGNELTVNATFASGDATTSTWTATLPAIAENAYTMLQARVTLP